MCRQHQNNGSGRVFVEALESRALLSSPLAAFHISPLSLARPPEVHRAPRLTPQFHVRPTVDLTEPQGYTPQQMRRAYGLDSITLDGGIIGDGAGQTIAIITAYDHPFIANDLAVFSEQFGLPQMNTSGGPKFRKIAWSSGRRKKPVVETWAMEASLDVQWAHAIAPRANIVLVEAKTAQLYQMVSAVRTATRLPGVSVIGMSWGGEEFYRQDRYDRTFTTPWRHTNITFIAASGDEGAPGLWPSVSTNVLSVGGTTLLLDSNGNVMSESGWSGSGGGVSTYVAKPSYQADAAISDAFRTTPDVSYNADIETAIPVYSSVGYHGRTGWFQVGGTSAGVPQWAGIIAIANQGRALRRLATLDGPRQVLPALYQMPSSFRDITSGSSNGTPVYFAGTGYDAVTGLGSPLGVQVIDGLQTLPGIVSTRWSWQQARA